MSLLILKTNLKTRQEVETIQPLFNLHPAIVDWNIDTEDIDNVLRIKANRQITETDIIDLLRQYNIYSEQLND